MNIAILALQGDVYEHKIAIKKIMKYLNVDGKISEIKNFKDKSFNYDALILPGGESTVMRILGKEDLYTFLNKVNENEIPIIGTCAGLILLSKKVDNVIYNQALLDIEVERNAYGRQKDSFETEIEFKDKEILKTNAIFIRAPIIRKVNKGEILAKFNNQPVCVKDKKIFGFTFHIELGDLKIYKYILKDVITNK